MTSGIISVIKVRKILLVTVPPEPDDEVLNTLQEHVLQAMERYQSNGLILDIATAVAVDSFFARMIVETVQMVELMGGRTVIAGMRPSVAIAATELGLTLDNTLTALDVDNALDMLRSSAERRPLP